MSNLIFNAFAYVEGFESNPGMTKKFKENSKEGRDLYLKNSFVSLKSAQLCNPDASVALITNLELEGNWNCLFEKNKIEIIKIDYDKFIMPKETPFSLAYFKFCALDYAINQLEYENYLMVDCDTYFVQNAYDIWQEAQNKNIILAYTQQGISADWRKNIKEIYHNVTGIQSNIMHISGGAIAGERKALEEYFLFCRKAYELIKENYYNKDYTTLIAGDEIIWSIAYALYNKTCKDMCPYGLNISYDPLTLQIILSRTNWRDENIVFWHMMTDKKYITPWVFSFFIRKNKFPDYNKMAKAYKLKNYKVAISVLMLKTLIKTPDTWKFIKKTISP